MKNCPMCGVKLQENQSTCPECGQQLTPQQPEPSPPPQPSDDSLQFEFQEKPSSSDPSAPVEGPTGLGGWLILFQISLYGNMILLIKTIRENFSTWRELSRAQHQLGISAYHYFSFLLLISALLIILIIILLYFLYKKKTSFKRVAITTLLVANLSFPISCIIWPTVGSMVWQEMKNSTGLGEIVAGFVLCALWIWYFCKSKRVKNTFIN